MRSLDELLHDLASYGCVGFEKVNENIAKFTDTTKSLLPTKYMYNIPGLCYILYVNRVGNDGNTSARVLYVATDEKILEDLYVKVTEEEEEPLSMCVTPKLRPVNSIDTIWLKRDILAHDYHTY